MSEQKWARTYEDCIRLSIYVQPGARTTEVCGQHGDALKIRIASKPQDGAANDELVSFLSSSLNIRSSQVRLVSGAKNRNKIIEISGLSMEEILSIAGA